MDGVQKKLRDYPIRRFFRVFLLGMGLLGSMQPAYGSGWICGPYLFTSGFMPFNAE